MKYKFIQIFLCIFFVYSLIISFLHIIAVKRTLKISPSVFSQSSPAAPGFTAKDFVVS